MTAEELYRHCLNLMGYTPGNNPQAKELFLSVLNNVLAECLDIENVKRVMKGEEELAEPQYVKGYADVLIYGTQGLLTWVSYGVCARLAVGDEDSVAAGYYDNLYEVAKMRPKMAVYAAIEDVYGGDGDE